jgi:dTDP-4-dehydrorhamnose reductase
MKYCILKIPLLNFSKQKLTKLSGKTFLITGAGGMLGRSFQEILNKFVDDCKIYALSKEELDVKNKEQVLSFQSLKPDFIIHCASKSGNSINPVDYCETHIEESHDLYVNGISNIIELAKLTHAKLFYPQTFLIFDGKSLPITEDTQPNPLCVYGKHKLQGQLLLNEITNSLIVVMGGFFGGRDLDKNFVGKIIPHIAHLIKTGVTSIEIGDRVWQPTFTNDLAYNILFLLENNKNGKYTMASHGKASFYELTKEIVSILNIKNKIKIIPVSASKFSSKESAMRPALALIENKKLTQENLDLQRKWQDSLREYLSHSYFLNLFKS